MRRNERAVAFLEVYNKVGHYRLVARFISPPRKQQQQKSTAALTCARSLVCVSVQPWRRSTSSQA